MRRYPSVRRTGDVRVEDKQYSLAAAEDHGSLSMTERLQSEDFSIEPFGCLKIPRVERGFEDPTYLDREAIKPRRRRWCRMEPLLAADE